MEVRKLAPKQALFVDAWPKYLNVEKAAKEAGLTYDYARKITTKPHMRLAMANAVRERSDSIGIDAGWVLAQAACLYIESKAEKQYAVAAKCLEIVGKHIDVRAFEESKQVNINLGDDSKWTIEVVHANHEERLIAQAEDMDVIEHKAEE